MSLSVTPSEQQKRVQVPQVGVVTLHPSVSPKGNRLAYDQLTGSSSIWSIELARIEKKDSRTRLATSKGFNWAPEFSPDGNRIVFVSGRSGTMEIWICTRDGTNRVQATNFGGAQQPGPPRWSPDSQRIVFDSALGEHNAIFVITAEGGLPRPLTHEASDNLNATWSRDGKWIYFTSNRSGQWQIWKMTSEGGESLQVTRQGGYAALESADGKFISSADTPSTPEIWRAQSDGGQETPVSPRIHQLHWKDWALVDKGIFFFRERSAPNSVLSFFDFSTATVRDVVTLEKPSEWISASSDGKFLLYHQLEGKKATSCCLRTFAEKTCPRKRPAPGRRPPCRSL